MFSCSITMDEEGRIEVRKPDLAERLTYLLAHFDDLGDQVQRYGAGDQGRLIAVLEYLGLVGGITKVTTEGEQPLLLELYINWRSADQMAC
jgi:hypothetical protein